MTQAFLAVALALGETMGPGGLGTSFVQQRAGDLERQIHALQSATETRRPRSALLQEEGEAHAHKHRAHAHEHRAHAHEHGKHRHTYGYGAFPQEVGQQVDQMSRHGVAEVEDGLAELRHMPDPAAQGIDMKNLDAQAAKSQQEMSAILKTDTAAPKPWVDDTEETIAKSQLQVSEAIKHLEGDFYGSLAQEGAGSRGTSLLEDGKSENPGSLIEAQGGTFMTAAERRAVALNKQVQAATANFDKDFAAGMAQGFQAAKAGRAAVSVGASGDIDDVQDRQFRAGK